MRSISEWMLRLITLVLSAEVSIGVYRPEPVHHFAIDRLDAEVSLTSVTSLIPLSYYSLPYCKPPWEFYAREPNLGFGLLLLGDPVISPYRFRVNVNESIYLCTTHPLSKHDVDLLKMMIRRHYRANIFLDSLPVMRYAFRHGIGIPLTGIPVGYYWSPNDEDNYYIINHLKFRVLVNEFKFENTHQYDIVGFEVRPCSVKHDPATTEIAPAYSNDIGRINCSSHLEKAQVIKEGESVTFSYEAEFVKSDIEGTSRWDSYLKAEGSDKVHWYSIIISVITALLLMGIIAKIFIIRNRTADLSDQDVQQTEVLASNLDPGGGFKGPKCMKLLCMMVGVGTQIMGTMTVTVACAVMGYISPASRGGLVVGIMISYVFLGYLAGFVSVYLWKMMGGASEGWEFTSWSVALGFPGIVLAIHSALNLVLWHQNSAWVTPVLVYVKIFSVWLGGLVPLTHLGGYLGAVTERINCPICVETVPRIAGAHKYRLWLSVLGAGTVPFGAICIELFYILSSLYRERNYDFYGFLLIVMLLLIIICVLTSMIVTYASLRAGHSGWWWKAFWASGSAGIYVFLYCIEYLICDLKDVIGLPSVIIYLGYSVIIAVSTMLAAGSVGFLGSFFVKLLSSSKQIAFLSKIL